MLNKNALILTVSALLSSPLLAHNLTVGESLPTANVDKHGELLLLDGKIEYAKWNSDMLAGKVRVIQAIAGRSAAKEMNADLMAAITAADFPEDKYQTTTIINQDDAMWGTGGFVKSSAEDSKQEFHWSSMVLDANGSVKQSWDLVEKSSAIIVLDTESQVLFAHEGKLTEAQIEHVLTLVRNNLK
ncbi:YtfJ family protein [Thaumasiovibrio subtropicus]|uniref:YtfJ family protein n=1 Tax=Thaumasiovibrio subtropicus TaxID=1891207 RepID=UPI000B363C14|nr:YtfJ family protein [Thaumasiovibrio subtropicus]